MRQNWYLDKPRMGFLLDLPRDAWVLVKMMVKMMVLRTDHDVIWVS